MPLSDLAVLGTDKGSNSDSPCADPKRQYSVFCFVAVAGQMTVTKFDSVAAMGIGVTLCDILLQWE